jgi:hypothetical protein
VKKRSQKTKEPIVDKEFKAIVNKFVKKEKKR